ncbi:probable UDP-N-acetylglucosamine--peptide N-acetylglucosaminyltransferase SEC [Manihot esculenta]|uniref:probable UDP-N-acetylglucosamine--peptide N-acetylglucosaminyltransferase SEC n=1 Tax=Manihot esculenta TaxID=3983 RepID=UPI001CC5FF95|nr:probable UDP-N-acetylglucosamine--peptide N-acetylglucosaminyltransferase SEC [Manihot esculenta]
MNYLQRNCIQLREQSAGDEDLRGEAGALVKPATLAVTTGLSAPFNNLAVIYKQQGNYADAISCYNEVLRIDPLAADGLVNRGNTYKEIGRVSEAIQDYIRAITIRPNMAQAHANLASAYKDRILLFQLRKH